MQIENDKVVTFFYQLSEQGGDVLESNKRELPMAYLHGHKNLLPALEEALVGLQEGDTKIVSLAPEQAYGQPKPDATQRIPVKHLIKPPKRLLPGLLVKVQTEQGATNGRIVKVGKFMVDIDFNHPFAGKVLIFDIKIESIREATSEEIQHGHAHGKGGHHH